MNQDAECIVRTILNPGERLIWAGRPPRGIVFSPLDFFRIPVGLAASAFMVEWMGVVIRFGPVSFVVLGVLLSAFAIYIAFGRFLIDAWIRKRMFYGLTSERVIVAICGSSGRDTKIKSLQLRSLPDVVLSESSNGRGTIRFGSSSLWFYWQYGMWLPDSKSGPPAFFQIDDVKHVNELLQQAQKDA